MRAHLLTLLIATLTTPIFAADFFSSIQSSIFSETSCISCLQRATALCGKDDIFDAHCICLGAGGTEIVRCFNSCSVDAQFRITGRFYTFCVPHFKDMCNGGEFVADKNVWEEACEKKKQDTPAPSAAANNGQSGPGLLKISSLSIGIAVGSLLVLPWV